jgi:hypothetical protein
MKFVDIVFDLFLFSLGASHARNEELPYHGRSERRSRRILYASSGCECSCEFLSLLSFFLSFSSFVCISFALFIFLLFPFDFSNFIRLLLYLARLCLRSNQCLHSTNSSTRRWNRRSQCRANSIAPGLHQSAGGLVFLPPGTS